MTTDMVESQATQAAWRPIQVYLMASICLGLGLVLGYLFRGSETQSRVTAATGQTQQPAQAAMHQMPTLEQMKQMADTKAQPLLAQLKNDPKNAALMIQVAKIYQATHQFQDAAGYYQQALN